MEDDIEVLHTQMKALIIGFGSIGKRHAANLKALQVEGIAVYDTDPAKRKEAQTEGGFEVLDSLDEALDTSPDAVWITTPTSSHVSVALSAAQRGCHLFIEKPLGDSLEGIDQLLDIIEAKRLVSLVGCNMRFHHGPSTIKRLLDEGAVGRPVAALLDSGQYLPDWHPREDYRVGYSAQRALGGGVILDGIHELDYARWLLGDVRRVMAMGGRLSTLEIDTEDCANILLEFHENVVAHVHLDYLQRVQGRTCKIIGEEGTILWDISTGAVRWYCASDSRWHEELAPPGYQSHDMYLAELRHFLNCLRREEVSVQDARAAKEILQVALAAKEAIVTGRPVEMNRVQVV